MSTSPPPGYASDPQLMVLWTAPPDLTGNGMQAAQAAVVVNSMPPESMPFTVNLASVQAAEQAMLTAGTAVVDAYNPMEQEVQQAIGSGTIFGQQATYNTGGYSGSHPVPDYNVPDAPLQKSAQQFAAQMNPAMTRVLRLIADGMSTVGTYMAMLNNAGQIYTASDKHSVVPPPPAPGGGS
jgi:hypothetical protein